MERDGPRPIFPKSVSFDLLTFSNKDFIVKDFIEGLSNTSLNAHKISGVQATAFDPKPYIRAFEAALERLKELDQDLSEKESDLKEGVRKAELEHSRTIERLGSKFNQTLQEFQRLDASISDGGGMAVQIGGQLELLDKQRQRAADAIFLIQCYSEFSKGDTSRLESLRKTGRIEDSIRCAVVSRQLSMIAKRTMDGKSDVQNRTRELIEKFSETLEKDLLRQFDRAYRKQQWEAMKGCAKVLYDFNGGASVTQIFVNQHDFFINMAKLVTDGIAPEGETWEKLSDPDVDPPPVEPSLHQLLREVKYVLETESDIIAKVFPQPEQVLGKFLQRVFQQSIQQRLELVLQAAESLSPLAFLRTLQSARSAIGTLVDELKAHGLTEHPGPLSSTTALVIDQNLDELFLPYLSGTSYIERERHSLDELYSGILLKFNLYHSRRKKLQNLTLYDRMKISAQKVTSEARDKAIEKILDSDLGKSRASSLTRIMGVDRESGKDKSRLSDIVTTEADGLLSVEVAKRILKWMAEAVGRSLELSPAADTPKDVAALLAILLEHMKKIYLETALESALDAAESSKGEPDLSHFVELKPATTIMHLMFSFINTALIPLASSSLTLRREMTIQTNTSLASLESRVNSVIQKNIDVVLSWVTTLLSKQRKQDFRPKDDDVSLTTLQTPTCLQVTLFLDKVYQIAKESLDGGNLDQFLTELGGGVRSLLLEHMKKFQVNAAGGLMLTKDMASYHALVKKWGVQSLRESFELLHEIANLYVVGPAMLKDRLKDSVLVRVRPVLLKPYLAKRDDYGSAGIEKILSES